MTGALAGGAAAPDPRPMRILIADDHAFFRRGLRDVLEEQPDMTVVGEAGDGAQALERVRTLGRDALDVVLMDIDMPGLDGIACTERLTAEFPDLPVVMLTVSTLDRDLFEAVRHGAVGFLSKSLSPDALLRALRALRRDEALPMSPSVAAKLLAYFQRGAAGGAGAATGTPTGAAQPAPPAAPAQGQRAPDVPAAAAAAPGAADLALTPREREVLDLIAGGARDREIAQTLVVSESTVKKHVQNILRKLHARSRAEAVGRLRGGAPGGG